MLHVLSRWEHVGESVQHFVQYKEQWISVSQYIIDVNNVGTNKNGISFYPYSYLNEDILYAHVLFVHAYISDKHFQMHKQICPIFNRVGFYAVDMGINL